MAANSTRLPGANCVSRCRSASYSRATRSCSIVPLPLGSLLLRHLASLEESWQVVHSPCCPRELPDVISENLSLDAGSPTPAVHRVLSPVSSTMSSAFPKQRMGRLPAFVPRITTSRRRCFEDADIP